MGKESKPKSAPPETMGRKIGADMPSRDEVMEVIGGVLSTALSLVFVAFYFGLFYFLFYGLRGWLHGWPFLIAVLLWMVVTFKVVIYLSDNS